MKVFTSSKQVPDMQDICNSAMDYYYCSDMNLRASDGKDSSKNIQGVNIYNK